MLSHSIFRQICHGNGQAVSIIKIEIKELVENYFLEKTKSNDVRTLQNV